MLSFKVADFVFQLDTAKEKALLPRMANFHPFLIETDTLTEIPLFRVELDKPVQIPEEEPLKVFDYDLDGNQASLSIYKERYILRITQPDEGKTFSLDCPVTKNGEGPEYIFTSDFTVRGIAPPRHIVDHLLVFAFSISAVSHQALVIHASTIVYRAQAVMFLAESGTGKSTHSTMWLENIEGAELLNDDAPVMRVFDDKVIAYGSPWSGKTPCYRSESFPLAACVRIRRAPYNKIEKQSSISAFGAILPSCMPTLQHDEYTLDQVCATLSEALAKTPIYILECLPDGDAAKVCREGVFPESKDR